MILSKDAKFRYLCVATASDGYYADTRYFQVQLLDELNPLILDFHKTMLMTKKDQFTYDVFDCSYIGAAELKLNLLELKSKNTR